MKNYKELIAENRAWAEETFKKIDAYAGGVHATSPARSGDAALKKLLKEAKK